MKRVNILDCTLRDGAYLIDSQFGNTAIKGIIEGLTESGIDVPLPAAESADHSATR